MLVDTEKMIPVTRLQRELTKQIRLVASGNSPLFVIKNNEMEAVILSREDYEYLDSLREMAEHFEIEDLLLSRLKNYNRKDNISWNDLQ